MSMALLLLFKTNIGELLNTTRHRFQSNTIINMENLSKNNLSKMECFSTAMQNLCQRAHECDGDVPCHGVDEARECILREGEAASSKDVLRHRYSVKSRCPVHSVARVPCSCKTSCAQCCLLNVPLLCIPLSYFSFKSHYHHNRFSRKPY